MTTEPDRFTKQRPCPICGGHKDMPSGKEQRCYGWMDSTGKYARCTREEHAGGLTVNTDGTYSHRLEGSCRCGVQHGEAAPDAPPTPRDDSAPTVRHVIRSADGEQVAVHARNGSGSSKRVWWEGGLNGTSPADMLYRAETLGSSAQETPVVLCEGEPAADAVASLGLESVGTVCGAAAQISPDVADLLAHRTVVWLWPDADDQGRAHMERNAQAITAAGGTVKFIEWADAPAKGDAADYVAGGGTAEGVAQMVTEGAQSAFYIDWHGFWTRDDDEDQWLLDGILARGRGHSIWAKHKVGKSLVTLWCVMELVKAGVVVIYLDYEMTEDDLRERLNDMGYGPDTDLSLLRYAMLPMLPPLDTQAGGDAVMALVRAEQALRPDAEVALIIDTIGRAVEGEENPADTIRAFYTHTGIGLKRLGVTWARLDHSGWEGAHARGSSAKGDDVDVIWKLSEVDGGLELKRDSARMGWVPEKVTLNKLEEPLRFERVGESWPNGTYEVATFLDDMDAPIDVGVNVAQKMLQEAGHGKKKTVVGAGVRWRRMTYENRSRLTGTTSGTTSEKIAGTTTGTTSQKSLIHGREPLREPPGTTFADGVGTAGGYLREPPRDPSRFEGEAPDPDEVFG